MAGVILEARIVNGVDLRTLDQESRQGHGVVVVARHPELEGLEAPQDHVGRGGVQRGAVDLPEVEDPTDQLPRADGHAAHGVRVAVEEFRRAVNDEIGAELEWLLVDRRREGVVHDHDRADRSASLHQALEGEDLESGVGRRLQIEHATALGDLRFDRVPVVGLAELHVDAEARQELGEDLQGAAVGVLDAHHPLARREQGEEGVADGGHSGGEARRRLAAFEGSDLLLEHGHRRVGVARVDVARLLAGRHRVPTVHVIIGIGDAVDHGHGRCAPGLDVFLTSPHRRRSRSERRVVRRRIHLDLPTSSRPLRSSSAGATER